MDPEKQKMDIQGYLNGKTTTEDNMTHYKEPKVDEHADPVPEQSKSRGLGNYYFFL